MVQLKKRFEDLTANDLQRACLSQNPTGKYVNITFWFPTDLDAVNALIRYNKRLGTFFATIQNNENGWNTWKIIEKAYFFTFKEAYQWLEKALFFPPNSYDRFVFVKYMLLCAYQQERYNSRLPKPPPNLPTTTVLLPNIKHNLDK